MIYDQIITKVSQDLNIDRQIVDKTYKSFWKFIKDTIQTYPLKDNLSSEQFSKLRTNFNIPSIGKLSCTYDRYIGIKKQFNMFKK